MRSPLPSPSEPTTVKPMTLRRLGTRRLARAHVTLSERPQVGRLARRALQGVCEALSQELSCPVRAEARLLESVVMPMTGLARGAAFALVELSATGGTGVLELEPSVLFAAMERLAGAQTRPSPVTELTRLEEASFAYLGLAVLAALRAQGELHRCFSPRLTGVTMDRSEVLRRLDVRQRHVGVELTVTVGQTTAGGRWVLPAGVLNTVLHELPVEREEAVAAEVLAARLEARCCVGRTTLAPRALAALGEGDVILFEGLGRGDGGVHGPGRLVLKGFELSGDFTPEGFLLDRAHGRGSLQELDMTVIASGPGQGMPPLPVEVEIELKRLTLSLSELAGLKPGALLPLRITASEPVLLRVGDRVVARAELVDIEGEVGARILALLP